ncbi:MAG TPA: Uma2 family endonuclease [Povalibacter sp.]|uniref:Uma2 family endonuclease n=1 Tax=Povalibacter sp. TaxID=1962978 RepID=UPI002C09A9A9|nr:Uma2 family endonuclease [Povalibacter sp.]HMN45879.1 Uma2 family endonuclease [Povalibacter sp.]
MARTPSHVLSVEAYLEQEADGRVRHEYVAGEIFAMIGGSVRHNELALRLATAFTAHLRGGPCRAYMSDVKVRIKRGMDVSFYYPDVMVSCVPAEHQYYLESPKLIVEVLSPTTEAIDRREKAVQYQLIETLEEYVLVAQDEREVTVFRRSEDWKPAVHRSGRLELRSIDLALQIEEIYD